MLSLLRKPHAGQTHSQPWITLSVRESPAVMAHELQYRALELIWLAWEHCRHTLEMPAKTLGSLAKSTIRRGPGLAKVDLRKTRLIS